MSAETIWLLGVSANGDFPRSFLVLFNIVQLVQNLLFQKFFQVFEALVSEMDRVFRDMAGPDVLRHTSVLPVCLGTEALEYLVDFGYQFFFVVALGDADYVDQPGSGDYRVGECLQVFSYLLG